MDDRRRDGGTNSTLRIKEQGMHLTLNEHDDDDDDDIIHIIILYVLDYYIIFLWDHNLICVPSLTETSLCGAYLYTQEAKRSHIEVTRSPQPIPKSKNVWSFTFTTFT